MPDLLQSKLRVPPLRRTLLPRPRLSAQLAGSTDAALTLVSAPAGFGKTTLLSEWLLHGPDAGGATAWVSPTRGTTTPRPSGRTWWLGCRRPSPTSEQPTGVLEPVSR